MQVRTRFAPSPTGFLHVGGARTALYCWLYARKHSGKFILRIEDTDLERSTEEAVQAIYASMQWLQLNHDEGPFRQTERFDRYRAVLAQLLAADKAYYCDCSKERLENLRAQQMANKQKPRYDGHCRERKLSAQLGENHSYVVRFRNPQTGTVVVDDQVRGQVVFQNSELDDLIIARSDGTPTYNFTVVVDDWDMQITHVIRGDDHLNNTPRQINLLQALGATPPIYAHIPMILGQDGKRLSKRHGAVSVGQYQLEGYLPEALLNYLVRLGWSHGDQEIFSLAEMIELFDLKDINKSSAAFDGEKLLWLNQHYLKTADINYIAKHLAWHMAQYNIDLNQGPDLTEIIQTQRERVKTLVEMVEKSLYFYTDKIQYTSDMQNQLGFSLIPIFTTLRQQLENLSTWSDSAIQAIITQTAETFQLKLGEIAQPLRLALTGGKVSPPINATVRLLGRTKTLARLEEAMQFIQTHAKK